MRRYAQVSSLDASNHTVFYSMETLEDCIEAIKSLNEKVERFTGCFRNEDDRLILTLFEAQSTWHDLTVSLSKSIIKLNERICELENLIREKS